MIEATKVTEATEAAQPGGLPEHDESVVHVLAGKILLDWLRNRQQLLVPFTLDLRKLDAEEASKLIHAMVAAAHADGTREEEARGRAQSALKHLHADADHHVMLATALEEPRPLSTLLFEIQDVQTGARVYAASLLSIDQRKPVNRHYLRYLAARLQLSNDLTRSLEQRFKPAL